ncbi:MAG: Flp family type IVb pilin [Alphaproteobacteria bacterium]
MNTLIKRFMHDEEGATAIEYGLIAALIAVAIVAVLLTLGPELSTTFTKVSGNLATANAKAP